jgi:hypothetical protein
MKFCKRVFSFLCGVLASKMMFIVCPVVSFGAESPEVQVATSLDLKGITLMPSSSPEFDAHARAIIPKWTDKALELKPCLVILSNNSAHTIVAYALRFSFNLGLEGMHTVLIRSLAPDAVAGLEGSPFVSSGEIRPGEEDVAVMAFTGEPNESMITYAKEQCSEFGNIQKLVIGIDGVILDDGALVGPSAAKLGDAFELFLKLKQDLYQTVVDDISKGQTVSEAFSSVTSIFALPPAAPGDERALYANVAAQDAVHWRKLYGDDAVFDLFLRAIRPVPFALRRDVSVQH